MFCWLRQDPRPTEELFKQSGITEAHSICSPKVHEEPDLLEAKLTQDEEVLPHLSLRLREQTQNL
jgi:hypothetical protein